jgi:6-phosphogluconolactonase
MITLNTLNCNQQLRWNTFNSIGDLEQAAAQAILHAADQAILQRGEFHIVLAGGTTPRRVYESLRYIDLDWSTWHVYFGDERCLPVDHAERNSRMAALAWLDHVAIPRRQIHAIPAEKGAEIAAGSYTNTLSSIVKFDLVLLGLGEDGHTASLFPYQDWGSTANASAAIAVHDAPKPPPDRVSLSANRLNATWQVMFMVSGESKRQAVSDWLKGVSIPATAISPACGVDVFIEAALL